MWFAFLLLWNIWKDSNGEIGMRKALIHLEFDPIHEHLTFLRPDALVMRQFLHTLLYFVNRMCSGPLGQVVRTLDLKSGSWKFELRHTHVVVTLSKELYLYCLSTGYFRNRLERDKNQPQAWFITGLIYIGKN